MLIGFFIYNLLTGETPFDFWSAIEGTVEAKIITIIFVAITVAVVFRMILKILIRR